MSSYFYTSKGGFIPPLFCTNVRKFLGTALNGSPESPNFYLFTTHFPSCLHVWYISLYACSNICFRHHYTASVNFNFSYYLPYVERLLGNTTVKLLYFNCIASMNIAHSK
jgi:hypothetical protein